MTAAAPRHIGIRFSPTLAFLVLSFHFSAAQVAAAADRTKTEEPTVVLSPDMDIQEQVDSHPAGTKFLLKPGVYRRQTIDPKDGQQFIGEDGATLSGSMLLTDWEYDADKAVWIASGLPPELEPSGECDRRYPLCGYREDLFVDGVPLRRVTARYQLTEKTWIARRGTAVIATDPAGKIVELSVTPFAFHGEARNVVIDNVIVEKYAPPAQFGAIDARGGHGWILRNVTARWNHSLGIFIDPWMEVVGGAASNNGQLGIGGTAHGAVIDGMEIAENNYANFDWRWEAGGAKFAFTDKLVVKNTCVRDNNGPGLWTDIDSSGVIYEKNKVFNNIGPGIKHEISYATTIRDNIVAGNGKGGRKNFLWGSQIQIQNSSDANVYDNLVEVAPTYGNGISMIYQDRRSEETGKRYATTANNVHNNTIVFLGDAGQAGLVSDADDPSFWTKDQNSFDQNTYVVPTDAEKRWIIRNGAVTWPQYQAAGYEPNGRLVVEARDPVALSCVD